MFCINCGSKLNDSDKFCNNCGKQMNQINNVTTSENNTQVKTTKKQNNPVGIVIGIIILIFGLGLLSSSTKKIVNESSNNTISSSTKQTISLEKFNKIKSGMTYKDVVNIIGFEGILNSETTILDETIQIYYWYSYAKTSNIVVSFINNSVSSKSQYGLK